MTLESGQTSSFHLVTVRGQIMVGRKQFLFSSVIKLQDPGEAESCAEGPVGPRTKDWSGVQQADPEKCE